MEAWEVKGDRKGAEAEHSRGGDVCGSRKRQTRGKEGGRESEQREREMVASLSPGLTTVRRLRLFITRPTPGRLFR